MLYLRLLKNRKITNFWVVNWSVATDGASVNEHVEGEQGDGDGIV